ncbi:MAG: NAD-dependent epimerase/dehydratase family protein [Nitrososphaerales archaeon]
MKLLVTGSNGLIGSAIKNSESKFDIIPISRNECDLSNEIEVKYLFKYTSPDYVINTAASVGGMGGNKNNHAKYFYNNTLINSFIIHYCYLNNVKKLLTMSSTCIFPVKYEEFDESQLHDGPIFDSHFAYGYSKRMIDVQIRAYEEQYGVKNYCCIIPGNVYGPNDSFNLRDGHVVASLLHKCYLAKKNNTDFNIWGDGSSLREFIYSKDLAKIMLELLEKDLPRNLLVCSPVELSIKELVNIIVEECNFTGNIVFSGEQGNGQKRKKSKTDLLKSILPTVTFTEFRKSIRDTFNWLDENYESIRQ